MITKSILLAVADGQALGEITQALGDEWDATSVANEAEALAELERRAFDALLVDFSPDSPEMTSQLLDQALEKRPETVRFLLAYEADLALVAAYVSGPHEILPKPVEPASLKSRIERALASDDSNPNHAACEPNDGTNTAPVVPAVYSKLLKVLDSPGVTASQVGEIIAEDTPLTYEVLRLTKSAYLGLPRNITDPVKAVEPIGLPTVRALVMALRFLAEHSQLKPSYLSFDKMWQHSINVAQLARDLILFETKDRALAAEALVAGLLHDLGKAVLVSNFDDLYGRVHSLARNQPVALWDIEKEMFGASHAEIGACLVGMWNMPNAVVQAVALHHEPPVGEDKRLTPLAAVHIANVLEHQIRPSDEFRVAPVINMAFLNDIGLLQRLPVWHAVFANHRGASASSGAEPTETSQPRLSTPELSGMTTPLTSNQLRTPTASTQTATSGQPETPVASVSHPRGWVYAGAAAAVLCFLFLWLETRPQLAVRALTPDSTPRRAAMVASPAPTPKPATTVEPKAKPAMAASEQAPATEAVLTPDPATTFPESEPTEEAASQPETATKTPLPGSAATLKKPEPTKVAAHQVAPINVTPPTLVATGKKVKPDFQLNGIIYTVARPAAIVNGQTVFVGDWVNSAIVTAISRTNVTLQINGRKVLVSPQGTD